MKTLLQKILFLFIAGVALLNGNAIYAQLDYFEDFSAEDSKWLSQDFVRTETGTCDNKFAFRANPTNMQGVVIAAEAVSPRLGISDGRPVTLSYNYTLLAYNTQLPYAPLNTFDWGTITLEYGPTINGPWTRIDVITPSNHIPTADCTQRIVTFTPPDATEVYIRYVADVGVSLRTNYLVDVSNISVFQDAETTAGVLVQQNDVMVHPNPVSDFLNLDYKGTLTNIMIFNNQGQEVPVENLERNLERLDLSTLAYGEYTLKLTINDEIKTVTITKK